MPVSRNLKSNGSVCYDVPKCSVAKHMHRNILDYNAINVYSAVLMPSTLLNLVFALVRYVYSFVQMSKNNSKQYCSDVTSLGLFVILITVSLHKLLYCIIRAARKL